MAAPAQAKVTGPEPSIFDRIIALGEWLEQLEKEAKEESE